MAELIPAWLRKTDGEHRWPAAVTVLVMISLQIMVADALNLEPGWLMPVVEGALLLLLLALDPGRMNREEKYLRVLGLTFVGAAAIANGYAALELIYGIATGKAPVHGMSPSDLLLTGGAVWLTNVIVFALVYWELDSGGPAARANARCDRPDFLFPQMTAPDLARHDWEPGFIDYLYVAFTNATAFSPTDTMPMTRWAKLTMMFQSSVSVALIALVIARSVNILST
ncbi:DUF1345 domain-containing protein [Hamadaea tsunoensis]|uniref:DUF1345 domain-containing protein n=1 Tax=Hamadaea tsunoensis TaxID=53368 RepID=UPI0003F76FCB|nr:DUF1345 domain-containing protein [Hamadaea tsunoensis]